MQTCGEVMEALARVEQKLNTIIESLGLGTEDAKELLKALKSSCSKSFSLKALHLGDIGGMGEKGVVPSHFAKVPLRGGEIFYVTEKFATAIQAAYPWLDIREQFGKMALWCEANPEKTKTRAGVKRFIAAWMARVPKTEQPKVRKRRMLGEESTTDYGD